MISSRKSRPFTVHQPEAEMTLPEPFSMTIGGKDVAGSNSMPVINPANGEFFASAPDCSREQLDHAVVAARKAFPTWSATPFAERQKHVAGIAAVLRRNVEELKQVLTREHGKPHDAAISDIMGGARWCEATAEFELPIKVIEDTDERRGEARRVPLGVVGAIAPWNYPVALSMFKVAPALLAGNTVVLKPSPFTPLTTLRIGQLLQDALPPGVLNVISGGDDLGPWMTTHPGIDKIAFTGSTETGRKVMANAAATLKRVTLELGGNDPAIVLPDVDVEAVAKKLFWAAFINTGQICMAAKRIYVHRDIYEPMKAALIAYAKTVKMGDGAEKGTQLGPIQNRPQYDRVLNLIADCKAKGYKFLTGGEEPTAPGYFVPITILDNPPEDSRIVQEEQFGPIMPLLRFDDVDDVVRRANATEYGLCASVWSADLEKALQIGSRLEAGTIWVNEAQYLTPMGPFGGHKQSGLGVQGSLEGLLEYTNVRTVFFMKP
jgi:acyl-CoA reductase-like NAD-dependent aldehyde dehydrogenase